MYACSWCWAPKLWRYILTFMGTETLLFPLYRPRHVQSCYSRHGSYLWMKYWPWSGGQHEGDTILQEGEQILISYPLPDTSLLELTSYNVYITAHGVSVIRPECSNTESAHFQLNNEIALKRDRWVFVLCSGKSLGQPQHWTKSRDLNINSWAAEKRYLQDPPKNPIFLWRDHDCRDMWHRDKLRHSGQPPPVTGPMSLLTTDIGVYWEYSLHIPQASLSTTGDPTQVQGINDTSTPAPITLIVTPGRSTSNIFVKNSLGMSVSKISTENSRDMVHMIILNYHRSSFIF